MIGKRPMPDRAFFDTNIIIYAYSKTEEQKRVIANELIFSTQERLISTQVINELSNTLFRKFSLDADSVRGVALELNAVFEMVQFGLSTQLKAIDTKARYGFSYYDSLIIATALENECAILYSEDMQHSQIVDDRLKIVNPFA